MNTKRYIIAAVALFIYIYAYEFLVHGMLLANIYSQTPTIWREPAEMMSHMPFNLMMMAVLSLWITYVFTRLFQEGGLQNGLKLGIYLGVLSGIQAAGAYYYLPISGTLAMYWFFGNLIESVIGGALIGYVYRK